MKRGFCRTLKEANFERERGSKVHAGKTLFMKQEWYRVGRIVANWVVDYHTPFKIPCLGLMLNKEGQIPLSDTGPSEITEEFSTTEVLSIFLASLLTPFLQALFLILV